jgi:hypothetical protein
MRWLRLFLLGLASVYPLYWTAQFVLFFLPETVVGFWLGEPVRVVGVSYLQAYAEGRAHAFLPAQWEALVFAVLFSALLVGLRRDRFLTGAFGVAVLGQTALLPFFGLAFLSRPGEALVGGSLAFSLTVFGLHRILKRTGGYDFLDRLALLSLFVVLPEAVLWLAFRMAYPYFDSRFLLLLLSPLYVAAIVAALLPAKLSGQGSGVPWEEIVASSAVACLLLVAIGLSSRSLGLLGSHGAPRGATERAADLAGDGGGMLT